MKRWRTGMGWWDWPLLLAYAALAAFGVAFAYSASPDYAYWQGLDPLFFFRRQVLFTGVAVVALLGVAWVDYHWLARMGKWILPGTMLLLVLIILGRVTGRLGRFVLVGSSGYSVQPAEVLKLAYGVYLALWLARRKEQGQLHDWHWGLIPFGVLTGLFGVTVFLQPDLSAAVTVVALGLFLAWLAGMPWWHIGLAVVLGGGAGLALVRAFYPYGVERWVAYWRGLQDPTQAFDQVRYAFMAFARGGWFGVGFGNARVKTIGLPLPVNDTIFAVIGEELGFVGAAVVVALFGVLLWRGMRIARQAPDLFGQLLAAGMTVWLVLEAVLNMASVLNLLPVTGNSLPFISLGGTNALVSSIAVGLVLNVGRVTARQQAQERRQHRAVVDLRGRHRRRRVPRPGRAAAAGE